MFDLFMKIWLTNIVLLAVSATVNGVVNKRHKWKRVVDKLILLPWVIITALTIPAWFLYWVWSL